MGGQGREEEVEGVGRLQDAEEDRVGSGFPEVAGTRSARDPLPHPHPRPSLSLSGAYILEKDQFLWRKLPEDYQRSQKKLPAVFPKIVNIAPPEDMRRTQLTRDFKNTYCLMSNVNESA